MLLRPAAAPLLRFPCPFSGVLPANKVVLYDPSARKLRSEGKTDRPVTVTVIGCDRLVGAATVPESGQYLAESLAQVGPFGRR